MAAAGLRLAATVDKIIAVARAFDGKDTPGNQSPSRGEPELSSLSFSDLPMTLNNSQVVRPSQRANILSRTRNLKMARDAHAYVRGSTERFYEWLEAEGRTLPAGPPVWICGDCHLGNLGPLADADGHIDIQIRDLDQTVIGNPAHDLVRLGLSLASAARGADLSGVTTARMLEEVVQGYQQAMAKKFDSRAEKDRRPQLVRDVLKRAARRTWRHLAEERIENVKPSIPLGKRFWVLSSQERSGLNRLFQSDDIRELVTSLRDRKGRAEIKGSGRRLLGEGVQLPWPPALCSACRRGRQDDAKEYVPL